MMKMEINSLKFVIDGWVILVTFLLYFNLQKTMISYLFWTHIIAFWISRWQVIGTIVKLKKDHFLIYTLVSRHVLEDLYNYFYICCIQFRNKEKLNLYYFTSFQKQDKLHVIICVLVELSPNTAVLYQPIFSNLIFIYVTVFHLTKKESACLFHYS